MVWRSSYFLLESMLSAEMPRLCKTSTWSFISAMSGDTTMVTPAQFEFRAPSKASSSGKAMAGIWNDVSTRAHHRRAKSAKVVRSTGDSPRSKLTSDERRELDAILGASLRDAGYEPVAG